MGGVNQENSSAINAAFYQQGVIRKLSGIHQDLGGRVILWSFDPLISYRICETLALWGWLFFSTPINQSLKSHIFSFVMLNTEEITTSLVTGVPSIQHRSNDKQCSVGNFSVSCMRLRDVPRKVHQKIIINSERHYIYCRVGLKWIISLNLLKRCT